METIFLDLKDLLKGFSLIFQILSYQHDGGGDDDEGSDETGNGKVHCLPPPGHVVLCLCRRGPVSKIHAPGPQPGQVRQGGFIVSIWKKIKRNVKLFSCEEGSLEVTIFIHSSGPNLSKALNLYLYLLRGLSWYLLGLSQLTS